MDHAVLVHVLTKKGKGYAPAELNPSKFHGIAPFDLKTGEVVGGKKKRSYTDVFSEAMCRLGEKESKMVAITAAMKDGTGLCKFQEKYPERFFDVGIAEEHAVTFAAGMAAAGLKPVFAVYSAFLQRAYDQIVHDTGSLPSTIGARVRIFYRDALCDKFSPTKPATYGLPPRMGISTNCFGRRIPSKPSRSPAKRARIRMRCCGINGGVYGLVPPPTDSIATPRKTTTSNSLPLSNIRGSQQTVSSPSWRTKRVAYGSAPAAA